jgi:hypothetical protein
VVTVRCLDGGGLSTSAQRGVAFLHEMAAEIRDQAVALTREKLVPDQRQAPLDDLLALPGFRRAFVQALALGVAQALADNDLRVLAVYAHMAAPDPGAGAALQETALAHLLVRVTAPSAALEAFVAALNGGLSASLSGITGTRFGQCQPLLDINIVTEQEVQQGVGLARLLSAVRPRPIKLWQRPA